MYQIHVRYPTTWANKGVSEIPNLTVSNDAIFPVPAPFPE